MASRRSSTVPSCARTSPRCAGPKVDKTGEHLALLGGQGTRDRAGAKGFDDGKVGWRCAWRSPRLAASNATLPFRRPRPLTQIKSAAFLGRAALGENARCATRLAKALIYRKGARRPVARLAAVPVRGARAADTGTTKGGGPRCESVRRLPAVPDGDPRLRRHHAADERRARARSPPLRRSSSSPSSAARRR